jgi:hypothetical protein
MDHFMEFSHGKFKYTEQWAVRFVGLFAFGVEKVLQQIVKHGDFGST